MKKFTFNAAALALVIGMSSVSAQANPNEEAFLQCMQDCQDWQPDTQTVRQCENWCYATFNPQ